MSHLCWNCKAQLDILEEPEAENGDTFTCHCGERCVIHGYRTISTDEAYEGACDSEASRRYEDAAYGSLDTEDCYLEPDTSTFRDD
jgi:hypothetical protein